MYNGECYEILGDRAGARRVRKNRLARHTHHVAGTTLLQGETTLVNHDLLYGTGGQIDEDAREAVITCKSNAVHTVHVWASANIHHAPLHASEGVQGGLCIAACSSPLQNFVNLCGGQADAHASASTPVPPEILLLVHGLCRCVSSVSCVSLCRCLPRPQGRKAAG